MDSPERKNGSPKLSPLDQVMPRFYTRIVLPFVIKEGDIEAMTTCLHTGLMNTMKQIPFLTQEVIQSSGHDGRMEFGSRFIPGEMIWKVKDFRKDDRYFATTKHDQRFAMLTRKSSSAAGQKHLSNCVSATMIQTS